MSIDEERIAEITRKKALKAFTFLKGKSVKVASFKSQDVTRNLYHDVVDSSDKNVVDTYVVIDVDPPVKVIKKLNWWKEDESLPFLAYFPYQDNFTPKQKDKFEVFYNGYSQGVYIINMVKTYGYTAPVIWVCNISPDRKNGSVSFNQ